jgi:hypothetical protein
MKHCSFLFLSALALVFPLLTGCERYATEKQLLDVQVYLSDQIREANTQLATLVDSDRTYWNGYSDGITACYKSQK